MPRRPLATQPDQPLAPRRHFMARMLALVAGGAFLSRASSASTSGTLSIDPFIGEIIMFAGNFAPRGWAFCNGQLLPINQYTALFSLLGTTYGGNGQTTFALPDLRGRAPIHAGQGPGLSQYWLGQSGGTEVVTLTAAQMPAHSHALAADAANGTSDAPAGKLPARDPAGIPAFGANATAVMAANAIGQAGSSQPHDNRSPYLAIHYIIALEGIYPSQS